MIINYSDFPSHILAAGDVVAVCLFVCCVFLPIYVSAGAPDNPVYGRSLLSFLSTGAAVDYPVFDYWYLSFQALSFSLMFTPSLSLIPPFKKQTNNGAANYDENTGTVGFGFADACASESRQKNDKAANKCNMKWERLLLACFNGYT